MYLHSRLVSTGKRVHSGKVNLFFRSVLPSHSPRESNARLFYSLVRYFVYFFDLVIFANAVFIALERNDAEVLFLALFNLEIVLKLYTYGFKEFFSRYWNM